MAKEPIDPERRDRRRRSWLILFIVAAGVAAITAGVTALLVNIFEHKQEARNPFYRVVESGHPCTVRRGLRRLSHAL